MALLGGLSLGRSCILVRRAMRGRMIQSLGRNRLACVPRVASGGVSRVSLAAYNVERSLTLRGWRQLCLPSAADGVICRALGECRQGAHVVFPAAFGLPALFGGRWVVLGRQGFGVALRVRLVSCRVAGLGLVVPGRVVVEVV